MDTKQKPEPCWSCGGKGVLKPRPETSEEDERAYEQGIMDVMLGVLTGMLPATGGYGTLPDKLEQDDVSNALLAAAEAGQREGQRLNKMRKKAKLPTIYVETGNILASAFCAYLHDNDEIPPCSALGEAMVSFACVFHALEAMSNAMGALEDSCVSLSQARMLRGPVKAQAAENARRTARWEKKKAAKAKKKA
jgi:hypothetical protein